MKSYLENSAERKSGRKNSREKEDMLEITEKEQIERIWKLMNRSRKRIIIMRAKKKS